MSDHLKVVQFPPTQISENQEALIETLEMALADAKAGRMTDLAIAFRNRECEITTYYGGNEKFMMLGACEYLAHRIKVMLHNWSD